MATASRRPRVLSFAFACSPEHGSEAASAWGVAQALAEVADVVVLTRPRHARASRRWKTNHPDAPLTFVEVPQAELALRLLRRLPPSPVNLVLWRAHYLLWLRNAERVARRLHALEPFDVGIHSSLGIYWLPAPVVKLPIPSVWGPVSGAPVSTPSLWRHLGWAGAALEQAEAIAARLAAVAPATRRTWREATIRLVDADITLRKLPRALRPDTVVLTRGILAKIPDPPALPRQSYLTFTSPLQRRKGPRLAVRALALTPPSVRLVFIHEGPEERPLRRLAERLDVADRVEFRGKVPRDEMFKTIAEAAAVVFTSPADEGSSALAEAMLGGAPVIVLGVGGARQIAESGTDPSRVAIVEPGRGGDTARRTATAMTAFSASPPTGTGSYLDQDTTKRRLQQIVVGAGTSPR